MFDQILATVKEHLGSQPQVAQSIPPEHAGAIHNEIASHVAEGLNAQSGGSGGTGGLLSSLQHGMGSGNPIANAVEGGLASSLASKFGLPPAITGAISASLPGLIQKFAQKQQG